MPEEFRWEIDWQGLPEEAPQKPLGRPPADSPNAPVALPSEAQSGAVPVASPAPSTPPVEPVSARVEPAVIAEAGVSKSAAALIPEASPASPPPTPAPPAAVVSQPPVPAPPPLKLHLRDRLPNASVGKPYSQSLGDLFGENFKRIVELKSAPPPGSGLALDVASATLHGTPTTPGEMQIVLSFRLSDSAQSHPDRTHTLALTVNPDPRSLWKNLPSDKNGAFAKPDTDSAFLVTPHLTVMAASLRGRSHAHEGKYREDDFGIRFIESTSWHILISADGAGSAKFSRKGSQLACRTATAEIEEKLGNPENALDAALAKLGTGSEPGELETLRKLSFNVLMPAAYAAFTAIHKQAKESQATPRDFATTFIAVIARKLADRWFLASFAIGDGGAGAVLEDGRVLTLTAPDSGDFAGQTVFLTMQQIFTADPAALLARTQAHFCKGFKFLAAMSDGITDPVFQSDANFASDGCWEEFRRQLAAVVNLDAPAPGMDATLLDWLNFPSPGNHDDRTLLVAVPTPAKL